MKTVAYLLWSFVYLTHTVILVIGRKGLLGKEAQRASKKMAQDLKIGMAGLIILSFICGTIFYLICGSGVFYLFAKMFRWL